MGLMNYHKTMEVFSYLLSRYILFIEHSAYITIFLLDGQIFQFDFYLETVGRFPSKS